MSRGRLAPAGRFLRGHAQSYDAKPVSGAEISTKYISSMNLTNEMRSCLYDVNETKSADAGRRQS